MKMDVSQISEMLSALVTDSTIPKNIRKALSEAKGRLDGEEEINVKVSAAIYLVESISDDINMPAHARTQVWAILSALESIKRS
ncbi:MAG: UPF0147 family protein [Candidatus Micrarchaeota archaeon]